MSGSEILALAVVAPMAALVCLVLVPSTFCNRHRASLRRWVGWVTLAQLIIAAGVLVAYGTGVIGEVTATIVSIPAWLPANVFSWTVRLDGVSLLMLTLVSFVGWITARYSQRYLDGEFNQGRYFRFTAVTIGSVCLMVTAGNLLFLALAWVATSLGLHQLLLHYSERPAAQRAAWTKFVVSRIGDLSFVIACGLVYANFKTLDINELFEMTAGTADGISSVASAAVASGAAAWITGLLIVTAMTKSAQFPFHSWLPQTMETPTPVSALMHAGIVNAGGYLLIRNSSLVSLAPGVLLTLAFFGAITAIYASVVMLTQTSIKRSLAYSTIAQMGFMMLQCGLGAFAAAMLHLLAHSLYKANAFLRSGSVLTDRAGTVGSTLTGYLPAEGSLAPAMKAIASAAIWVTATYVFAAWAAGLDVASKPGGFLLGFVLCLAVTYWLSQVFLAVAGKHASVSAAAMSAAIATGLSFAYVLGFQFTDWMVGSNVAPIGPVTWMPAASVLIGLGFMGLFAVPILLSRPPVWATAFYVHASNGFYIDALLRRTFRPLLST